MVSWELFSGKTICILSSAEHNEKGLFLNHEITANLQFMNQSSDIS